MEYAFDRFLRYDELTTWLHDLAAANPSLVAVESYGTSHEGRDLWVVTITDSSTGAHDTKPAHWVDANIHSVEVTASVAALYIIHHLVSGFGNDARITEALRTRTFYVVPRVNPDGVEWTLADSPQFRRSSVRAWPWRDAHRQPGLHERDMDGDGRVLTMRIADPNGSWMPSPDEPRLLARVPPDGAPEGTPRYRLLIEGEVEHYDGFTVPTADAPQRLDLNRNFPSGWGTSVRGSGDHPLSEPEIDSLVRAIVQRPNICGYNAFHTSGGVLLRPSLNVADAAMLPGDLWVWKLFGDHGKELTGYPHHNGFDDFTFDKSSPMSGCADDWAYDHLGVYGWTTEFWDVVHAATGTKPSTHIWYTGPTPEEELAVYRWAAEHHPEAYGEWTPFDHPQLGAVEIGGWDEVFFWANPPASRLLDEVKPHAEFAVYQALCSPRLEILHTSVAAVGDGAHRVEVGIANTGWLPTQVSEKAYKDHLVLPIVAELSGGTVLGGTARQELGQLAGRMLTHFTGYNDGSPDRALVKWLVEAPAGTSVTVEVRHQRAGSVRCEITL